MRLLHTFAFLIAATLTSGLCAAEKLKLDAENSSISFVGSKPDKSTHKGGFKEFDVEAIADFENGTGSSIKIEIKTASIWSDNERLTGHLKNADFFDVRKYPTATFESTSIEADNETEVVITGKLKMLDKTGEVKAPFKVEHSDGAIKLVGKFKLDRTKWGMNYGAPDKINNEVEMDVSLSFKY